MISESILLGQINNCNGCLMNNGEEPDICHNCGIHRSERRADKNEAALYRENESCPENHIS